MENRNWDEIDDEALEETAAAPPDTLTDQQRLLLGRYYMNLNTESEIAIGVGAAETRQPTSGTDTPKEKTWEELDEEALEEVAAAPQESLTEQQRLCLATYTEPQLPNKDEAEDQQTTSANGKTEQNVFRVEGHQHILCPWKQWIYHPDNSTANVKGHSQLRKPSNRPDAYRPARPSMLCRDITEILKTREMLERNRHLQAEYEQPNSNDYFQAHHHGYRLNTCRFRGPSHLRQVSTAAMTIAKAIFDKNNTVRNVDAWQHHQNRDHPRRRSPLRQTSNLVPQEATTTDGSAVGTINQEQDPMTQSVLPVEIPEVTTNEDPMTQSVPHVEIPEVTTNEDPMTQSVLPAEIPETATNEDRKNQSILPAEILESATNGDSTCNRPQSFRRYCLFRIASVLSSASKVANASVNLIR